MIFFLDLLESLLLSTLDEKVAVFFFVLDEEVKDEDEDEDEDENEDEEDNDEDAEWDEDDADPYVSFIFPSSKTSQFWRCLAISNIFELIQASVTTRTI